MSFIAELKRRNVFRVALAYLALAWLLTEVADTLFPAFGIPDWGFRFLVIVFALGFVPTLIFSWAYEITPEGLKRDQDVVRDESIARITAKRLDGITIALIVLAGAFVVADRIWLRADVSPDPSTVATGTIAAPAAVPQTTARKQAVAVLPFRAMGDGTNDASFFSDGIHGELINRLAKISELKVISRTSVMEYRNSPKNIRQIGEELGAGSILEGGVQRDGNVVRVNVQLIDTKTDQSFWGDLYERELNAQNIFAIQSEISSAIAGALQATLSPVEQRRLLDVPTESMQALEAYFEGKLLVDRRDPISLVAAIEQLQHAVELDPQFALAWSELAEAWLDLPAYSETDPMHARRKSAEAASKAVELNPEMPNALAVLAWYRLRHEYDWAGAEESFKRALEVEAMNVNTLHWYSHLLSWQGKHQQAIALARKALESDPRSTLMQTHVSYILADAKRWEESFALGHEILEKDSYSSLMANLWIAKMRAQRPQEAAALLESWAVAEGRSIEATRELGNAIVLSRPSDESSQITAELILQLQLRAVAPETRLFVTAPQRRRSR
jgi:TolB-like protein